MRLHYSEFWQAVKAQLNTALMQQILNGGKVYLQGEDYSTPEGPEGSLWGRVVVVPAQTAWPNTEADMGPTREVPFLVRAEFSDFTRPGYDVQVSLDAAQDEAENQLIGWVPTGLPRITVVVPIYLQNSREVYPFWDDDRGLHFNSAQFRTEVAKV